MTNEKENIMEFMEKYGKRGYYKLFISNFLYNSTIKSLKLKDESYNKEKNLSYLSQIKEKAKGELGITTVEEALLFEKEIRKKCNEIAENIIKDIEAKKDIKDIDQNEIKKYLKKAIENEFDEKWEEKSYSHSETDLLLCDGLSKEEISKKKYNESLKITFGEYKFSENCQKIDFDWDEVNELYKGDIPKKIEDFLKISSGIYTADKQIDRKEDGVINLAMPVSDVNFWSKNKSILEYTLSELTKENYKFNFLEQNDRIIKEKDYKETKENIDFDCVCLLSGGLDSFSGAQELVREGKNIVLTNVAHSKKEGGKETDLWNEYFQKIGKNKHVKVYHFFKGNDWPEKGKSITRSRSFLFLTCAVSSAIAENTEQIYIPEQGVIAYIDDIPFSKSIEGTRTVHPEFINKYQKFVNRIFESDFKIKNPFKYKTKGDILEKINEKSLINNTISCSNPFSGKCGKCIPCLLRRFGIIYTGLIEYDEETEKWVGKLDHLIKDNLSFKVKLLEIIDFTSKILLMNQSELKEDYPKLDIDKVYKLFYNFSIEALGALFEVSKDSKMTKKILDEKLSERKKIIQNKINEGKLEII